MKKIFYRILTVILCMITAILLYELFELAYLSLFSTAPNYHILAPLALLRVVAAGIGGIFLGPYRRHIVYVEKRYRKKMWIFAKKKK